jgi:hypothetical protein
MLPFACCVSYCTSAVVLKLSTMGDMAYSADCNMGIFVEELSHCTLTSSVMCVTAVGVIEESPLQTKAL